MRRSLPVFPYEQTSSERADGPFRADIVAKVENRTTLKISRKPMFRPFYRCNAARPDTKVRGRFCAKQCGPSRRRVRTASVVLKNCVRQPEKTFATLSARSSHSGFESEAAPPRGRLIMN